MHSSSLIASNLSLVAALALAACAQQPAAQSPGQTQSAAAAPATGSEQPSAAAGGAKSSSGLYPAQYLDLTNWKLTLPIGNAGKPTEVKADALKTYAADSFFFVDANKGVVFRANAGGVTTPHSKYPRTELREMTNGGKDKAAWSTTEGKHSMTITEAITHLPVAKPHIVAAQIHDESDDVVMVRLERDYLFVEGGGSDLGALVSSYQLGTPFTVKLEAQNGRVRVYFNDMSKPKVDIERKATGCYFKAGAYVQSNPEKGDDASAYGEVVISKLALAHE